MGLDHLSAIGGSATSGLLLNYGTSDEASTALIFGIGAASSSTLITTATADKNWIQFYTKSTATSGTSRGIYNRLYLAGAGVGGESLRSFTTVQDVAAGTAHGAHISLSFGTTGSITGLGVPVRSTLHVPNQAQSGGTYAGGQSEIYYDGASSNIAGASRHSIHRFIQDGNATAYAKATTVFEFVNLSTGATKMLVSASGSDGGKSMRWLIDGTEYFCSLITTANALTGDSVTSTRTLTSQTTENTLGALALTTDSTYLTGTNITYSGARGSSALKLTGVWTGTSGGYSNIYSNITTSGALATDNDGVIGIKQVVTNSGALTDGNIYGGQFIAKHSHATNTMANAAALIGIEAWGYIAAAGGAGTVIGGNFGWHNEATGGTYAGGAVHRGVQIFCDNNAGGNDAAESTGLCIWNQAGTITNAINVVNSGSGFTNFVNVSSAAGFAAYAAGGYTPTNLLGYLTCKVGARTQMIPLYETMTPI